MSLSFDPMSQEEFEQLKVGGVKVHYYVVCHRKLWLYSHDIRMEQSSDRVLMGKLLHEHTYCHQHHKGLLMDNLIQADLLESGGKGTISHRAGESWSRTLPPSIRGSTMRGNLQDERREMSRLFGEPIRTFG
jgi:CRISPR/Cas system-associated exonuclease Cas4 (RecB family)